MKLLFTGLLILICYAVLLVQFYRAFKKQCISTADVVTKNGDLAVLNQRHAFCLLVMVATILLVGCTESRWLMLQPPIHTGSVIFTTIAGAAAVAVSTRAARQVLQARTLASTPGSPHFYLFLRGLFLVAYELFFRAILLQFCLVWLAMPAAIVINVVLYAGAHLFSTRQELIGTVPFGLLLCGITLYSQSILPAILIHLFLGLPYDLLLFSTLKLRTKTIVS
jgi:membrane protease YdiL (CAAX protease family)